MNVVVFGSTGPTGIEIVKQLLEADHQVTAIARTPSKLEIAHPNLAIRQGDVLQLNSFLRSLEGMDLVISSLGSKPSRKPIYLYSQGVSNILTAMNQHRIGRLFCVTAAALQKEDPNLPFYFRYFIRPLLLQRIYDDMNRMESLVQESNIDYTFVRPPRLVDTALTGKYRTENAYSLPSGKK